MKKLPIKKILIIVGIIGIIALIGFNVYYFGWLKMRDKIHQEGVAEGIVTGRTQVNNAVIQEFQNTGGLRLTFTVLKEDGTTTTQTIILVPKQ